MRFRIKNKLRLGSMILLVNLFMVVTSLTSLNAQNVMRINRVWCGIVDNGGPGSFEYSNFNWPADYNCIGPTMQEGFAMTGSNITTACRNWLDPNDVLWPKGATRTRDGYDIATVTEPLVNSIRVGYPTLINDFEDATLNDWAVIDPSAMVGTSDQTATVTYVNAMGVEIKRTIFAWSQKFHDNYIVVDLVLTNLSGVTRDSFYVSLEEGPFYMRKAKGGNPSVPPSDRENVIREACWHHYYGGRPDDSLRIHYMYNADNADADGDQMGGPVESQDGRLMESDIMFYGILHASKTPYTNSADDKDDPLQPKVTFAGAPTPLGIFSLWASNDQDRSEIYDLMAGKNGSPGFYPMPGQRAGTFHEFNNDEQNDPNYANTLPGFNPNRIFNRSYSSFGPYTFGDGESIRIVYVSGFAGIGIEKEKEIGEKWKAGTLEEPPNLPNATTGYFPDEFAFPTGPTVTEMDRMKDRWISTGIDSVHKAVSRAKWNFEHGWQVPGTPPPPKVEVDGTGLGVEVIWSDPEAEALQNFAGYRILKRIGNQDTVFFEVAFDTLPAVLTGGDYRYIDDDVLFGASYYYYVQAGVRIVDDQSAYPDSRGKTIWSSRLWIPTNLDVNPARPKQDDLSKIRIVPNPYNIKNDLLEGYSFQSERKGLQFYNLPGRVTIKIFTESGDLVRRIEHDPPSESGYELWNMLTDNQQDIASGVYIAVFETPDGDISYQKFIIVR